MKLSTRSRYGIRMMLDIASHGQEEAVSLQSIAKRQDISLKYLEKITRILKGAGYLQGKRGPRGGHKLTCSPEEIYLGDLVLALEGDLELVNCWADNQPCPKINECKTHKMWDEMERIIYEKLNSLTLMDLNRNERLCREKLQKAEVE
jgi:Rrf2 family protein